MVARSFISAKYQFADIPLILKFTFFVEIIFWIPLAFIGFDAHHDGLILTTVHLTKDAIQSGSPWPFNQYGPAWVLIYSAITWPLPSEWLFLSLRLITILSYLITGLLIWKIGTRFISNQGAFITMLVFFFSQPFVSNLGSDLVPWPSSILMPIVAGVTLLSIRIIDFGKTNSVGVMTPFLNGLFVTILIFSRVQVGFAILIIEIGICLFAGKRHICSFLFGLILGTSMLFSFLLKNGFLLDSLRDEFVFGASYLSGDRSSYPKPLITFLGVAIFLVFLCLSSYVVRIISKYSAMDSLKKIVIFGLAFSVFLVTLAKLTPRYDLLELTTLASRRIWISYFLAIIIYSAACSIAQTYWIFKENHSIRSALNSRNLLVLISIASQSQIFPLFDQMHFWWGSVPAVILVCLVTREKLIELSLLSNLLPRKLFIISALPLCILLGLIPWMNQISQTRTSFDMNIARELYTEPELATQEKKLQQFFSSSIAPGDSVLNLCENANVFFVNNSFKPSSRIFVLWANIAKDNSMVQELIESRPNKVVTCSMNRIPNLQKELEITQAKIVSKAMSDSYVVAQFSQATNLVWTIYANQN